MTQPQKPGEVVSSNNDDLIHLLNSLSEVCHNGHDGYMEVANGINSAAYKTMFAEYALQRRRFASQLANLVTDLGGDPDDDGIHDSWKDIRPVIMGGDHGAIFDAIERAEDAAINTYEKAMESDVMTSDVHEIVDDQCAHIIVAHDRIRSLRDAYRKQNQ